jgi:hypothetical protein
MIDRIAKWLANAFFDAAMAVEAWRKERLKPKGDTYTVRWAVVCRHCRRAWMSEMRVSENPFVAPPSRTQCPTCLRMEGEPATCHEFKAALEAEN